MKTITTFCCLAFAHLFLLGCEGDADPWRDYKQTLESGQKKIPWVKTVESFFPMKDVDHFITHYGFDKDPKEWQTVVYFGGKYQMQITQTVKIDYRKNEISEVMGEMKFVINEVVEIDPSDLTATFGGQARGGPREWKVFEEAKGDLASLPLKIERNSPIANFDSYRRACGKDIIK